MKKIIGVASATIIVLFIGLLLYNNGQTERNSISTDPATDMVAASVQPQNAIMTSAKNGEPIPNEYIVKKTDGSYALVQTDDPESLCDDPDIVGVEQNRIVTAFEQETDAAVETQSGAGVLAITGTDVTDMQYGDKLVNAPQAWSMIDPEECTTVRVAVLDTGVDSTHPDLQGRVLEGKTIVAETANGDQYADDGKDDHGHGTHVAGIISATIDNSIGINGILGNVDVEILPVKVLNDAGEGSTFDIIEGIRYAADNGASIMNLSLGSYNKSEMEEEAVQYAQNKGCLIIAAAGNDAFNVQYTYPASYDGVISVGSVDSEGERSYFSNFGETLDVSAPGSDIVSTIPKTIAKQTMAQGGAVYGSEDEGYYISMSGTSMATPHAVGVAALYKALHPDEVGFDIGNLLIETCQDVGDPGKDIETGAGIVDAAAMLGGEIIKTPLMIKNPSNGQEVYEEVNLSAQINPSMGITKLRFYLDAQSEENQIAETDCTEDNAFYYIKWDTTAAPDGQHQLMAAVFDGAGEQIGETLSVNIKILNSISNGFTLDVTDPLGAKAKSASYYVYQQENGRSVLAGRGKTSDLGYARVKGLSEGGADFTLIIYGAADNESGEKVRYVYKRSLGAAQLGTKIFVEGSVSRQVDFSTIGEDGEPLTTPYLKIYTDCGGSWLAEESAFRMQQDTTLYMDDGDYRAVMFHEVDRNGTAYCIEKEITVSESQRALEYTPEDGIKVQAEFPEDTVGEMVITGADEASEIPFLSGTMYGTRFYLPQGKNYTAEATLKAEAQNGDVWSASIQKTAPIRTDRDLTVAFAPQIGITEMELDRNEAYVGDRITAKSTFVDATGDRLIIMTKHFPVFRIYLENEGQRTLIYEKESLWNMTVPSWDSSKDYIGNVPPAAGSYVAELSFDAGPLGGETSAEVPFKLQTHSGSTEMSSTIRIQDEGTEYKAVGAQMALYTWDKDQAGWVSATDQKISAANTETGVIQGIRVNDITLNDSGIHAAVITLKERKHNYDSALSYPGFAVIPFSDIQELSEITINAEELFEVKMKASDQAGNLQAATVAVPINTTAGKLADPSYVGEYRCRISKETSGTILHVPAGSYDYVHATFNTGTENYVLMRDGFTAGEDKEIFLQSEDTVRLSLDTPEHYSLRTTLKRADGSRELTISPATGKIRITKGKYDVSAIITEPSETYRYTVDPAEQMDLTEAATWSISDQWIADLKLNSEFVKPTEDIGGNISTYDKRGNNIVKVEKLNEEAGTYEEVLPTITIGMEGETAVDLGSFPSGYFKVSHNKYFGEGTHTLRMTAQAPDGSALSAEKSFRVGTSHDKPIWKTVAKLSYEWTGTGELTLSWNPDDVKTYDDCGIRGYRIYYSKNELNKWQDITGDELITESSATVGMSPKTDGYYFKVEVVDEAGSESTTGPSVEVLGQYPIFSVVNDSTGKEQEIYTTDLMDLPQSQARYSARNSYGTDNWYAVEGIYFDDLLKALGHTDYTWIAVKANGMDPISFSPEDLAGKGYYYYPKNYDGDQVQAVEVKPILALGYTSSEDYEPAFGPGGEGLPRLFFGQQYVGDVNRSYFAKEVYEIVVYGEEAPPIEDETKPSDSVADTAPVDETVLSAVSAEGITAEANLSDKTLTIQFPAVENAVNYRIYYRQAGDAEWSTDWTGAGVTGYVLGPLQLKGLYEFLLVPYAKTEDGWVRGADSEISRCYFATVKGLKVKAGKRKFTAKWRSVKGASGYQVLYFTAKSMESAKIKTVKGASKKKKIVKKLKKKKRYHVRVRPYKMYDGNKYIGIASARKAVRIK